MKFCFTFCALRLGSNSDTLFCIEMGIAVSKEHMLNNLENDGSKNKKIITRREKTRNLCSP